MSRVCYDVKKGGSRVIEATKPAKKTAAKKKVSKKTGTSEKGKDNVS